VKYSISKQHLVAAQIEHYYQSDDVGGGIAK